LSQIFNKIPGRLAFSLTEVATQSVLEEGYAVFNDVANLLFSFSIVTFECSHLDSYIFILMQGKQSICVIYSIDVYAVEEY